MLINLNPLKKVKVPEKEVQSMKLIDIDEKSPYYYKLSKTQKQISNLLNDYDDSHVEDIRGNYLEVCKTKINFKDDYNMKILQRPNYKGPVKLNLMEEKKMPYGKYKGKDIDDLPEEYVEKVLIRSKLYLTNSKFRKIMQQSKFGDLIKQLNLKKMKSKILYQKQNLVEEGLKKELKKELKELLKVNHPLKKLYIIFLLIIVGTVNDSVLYGKCLREK